MDPLDVTHGVLRCWRAGIWGVLRPGHQHAPGVRLVSVPPIQACCQHAWCLACVEFCPLGREGSMIGGQIVPTHAMAKQLPLS